MTLPASITTLIKSAEAAGFAIHIAEPLRVVAVNSARRIAFDATFKPTETKKGAGAAFQDALVLDPEGIELPLRADYSIDKRYAKTIGLSPDEVEAIEVRRDAAYNDGSTYRATRHLFNKANEFKTWLAAKGKEST